MITLRIGLLSCVVLFVSKPCLGEQQNSQASECSAAYENHNQMDYGPLKVHAIRGANLIQVGSEKQPGSSEACFVLFTENDHRLVARVKADPNGHFEFKSMPSGHYRLIGRLDGFCPANIPIEVVKSSRRTNEIVVHFRARGTDICSTGELAPVAAKDTPMMH